MTWSSSGQGTGPLAIQALVLLLDARNAEGAEQHWRTHMQVAGRTLLRDDIGAQAVVDLFD
jgi:hypothetical protein